MTIMKIAILVRAKVTRLIALSVEIEYLSDKISSDMYKEYM